MRTKTRDIFLTTCVAGVFALIGQTSALAIPHIPSDPACEAGDSQACYDFALKYEKGEGVKPSIHLARKMLEKSCELNNAEACARLGNYYRHGIGVRASRAKSEILYEKANLLYMQAAARRGNVKPKAP